eukprot:TCALIF_00915-PA protein Name:"Similar to VPS41 Vacuolar protein sorting-associated protein 41 homolog (Homo sapiens)" AED:0.03 eAED:0.03 QI:173/0.5/0.66/1/1/1/3/0/890
MSEALPVQRSEEDSSSLPSSQFGSVSQQALASVASLPAPSEAPEDLAELRPRDHEPDQAAEDDHGNARGAAVGVDDAEETEDEEFEPKLKYERLSSDLKGLFSDDRSSCIAVHDKMMVLGTHWGRTHLLDAMGHVLQGQAVAFKGQHAVLVSQISVDHTGEFVGSCSIDGKVMIRGLLSRDFNHTCQLSSSLRAISIDPIYARSGAGRRFLTGEGPYNVIKWRGRFAAWSCRKGFRVYDAVSAKVISLIKVDITPREDVPPRITWSDQFHLYVAHGDAVRTCLIKPRVPSGKPPNPNGELPDHYVEIVSSFSISDSWVSGIAPLDSLLVLLTVPKQKTKDNVIIKPQLKVVEPLLNDYVEVSTDILSIQGHELYGPKDYHLESLVDDKFYFIVSPRDVVLGKPRDPDDHVDWLLEHEKFQEALTCAEKHERYLRRHSVLDVGRICLDQLLLAGDFDQAGSLCVRLFGRDRELWQNEVYKFTQLNNMRALAPFLPKGTEFRLDPQIYEMTIFEFIKMDTPGLLELIREWDSSLYGLNAVSSALREALLLSEKDPYLRRAVATIATVEGKYNEALDHYLRLGHEDAFQLIREYELFDNVSSRVAELMTLNDPLTLKLLFEHMDRLPTDRIVANLAGHESHLFKYLDMVHAKAPEEAKKYHGTLVSLYADYSPKKLLPFLRSSDSYPINEALEICETRGLIPERIFILARMGNTRQALQLITRELADIHKAVAFCKEHDDVDLWKDLIEFSLDKPYFVNVLLHNIGTHVDPRILIQRIEHGREIPGLRNSLVQIMHDYRLQVSLQEGCQRILVADCFNLLQKQVRVQTRGLCLTEATKCAGCSQSLVGLTQAQSQDVIAFHCHHSFHFQCLGDISKCVICQSVTPRQDRSGSP